MSWGVLSLIPQGRWQRSNEQITEDSVEEFKTAPQEKFSEKICEQVVKIPVPQVDAHDERQRLEERLARIWASIDTAMRAAMATPNDRDDDRERADGPAQPQRATVDTLGLTRNMDLHHVPSL